jgi:hypothetical protein
MAIMPVRKIRKAAQTLSSLLAMTVIVGTGAVLVGVAPAQAGRRDEKDKTAYTIKRIYKTGEVDRYRLGFKMEMDNPESPVKTNGVMVMKETTKEAADDGSSTVITEFDHAVMTVEGMDMDITSSLPKITVKRDRNGKTDVKSEGGAEAVADGEADSSDQFREFADLSVGFLPLKPVKVGESWEGKATGFGPTDPNAKGKVTLVSVETVKGIKVGKIKAVIDMVDEMNNKVHSETLFLIDMATGKTLDLISKLTGDTPEGKISVEVTTKMLDPNDKGDGKEAFKADPNFKDP